MFRPLALAASVSVLALPLRAGEVVVFAAASLQPALDVIARDWEARTGDRVLISYAGSGKLARQIIEGAPADIFFSAAENWMEAVAEEGLIQPAGQVDLLSNRLVLVGPLGSQAVAEFGPGFDLEKRLGEERLAMALVDSVPAGQYGKAALESLGMWNGVADLIVQRDDVRAALVLVETGEAGLGIVYATDARSSDKISLVAIFPEESHPPIRYPLALLSGAGDAADRAFYEALTGPEARAIFAAQGFIPLDGGAAAGSP